MSDEQFDFETERARWPEHWDHENGWPTTNSTWRARLYPQLRVRVSSSDHSHVLAVVYWDGDLEGLGRLFTYETTERWEIGEDGLVHSAAGIGPWEDDGPAGKGRHWRKDDWLLEVNFERPQFGGSDTKSGTGECESLPFFEPVQDWRAEHVSD